MGDTGTNRILTRSLVSGTWTEETVVYETTNMIPAIGSVCGEQGDILCAVVSESAGAGGEHEYFLYAFNSEEEAFVKAIPDPIEGAQIYEHAIYYTVGGEIFILDLAAGTVEETGLENIGDISVVGNGNTFAVIATVQDGLKNELYISYRTDDETTDIEPSTLNVPSTVIYDLMGRKVTTMVKGNMYIVNGKKVVIK